MAKQRYTSNPSSINFDEIKIEKGNEELSTYIRHNVYEALQAYLYKYLLWSEVYLEYHGISLKTFTDGDSFYWYTEEDGEGRAQKKKGYDRPLKLRNIYTAVMSAKAQVSKAVPDFMPMISDFTKAQVAETFAELVKYEWWRSKSQKEIDIAWTNAIFFGELITRNYYVEEYADIARNTGAVDDGDNPTPDTGETEEVLVYKGVKSKVINSFEFIPSADWGTDIQEASFVAIRKLLTPRQVMESFPGEFEDEGSIPKTGFTGLSDSHILDPLVLIRRVYESKVDPEVRDRLGSMMRVLGINDLQRPQENMVEVIEYFDKTINAQVVWVGGKVVEASHMKTTFYPISAHKLNSDIFTSRGIGDAEQALPLAKIADSIFDMKLKNLVLQLSSVVLYNEAYFKNPPGIGPGTAIGVELKATDDFNKVMSKVQSYSQNFEIQREQKDAESKALVAMGINDYIANSPQQSGPEATAKEAMIRNAAATANLDYKVRQAEQEFYTDIANQWTMLIAENYNFETLYTTVNSITQKYFYYLGNVEKVEKEHYDLLVYGGQYFFEPKRAKSVLEMVLADIEEEVSPAGESLSVELPAGETSPIEMDSQESSFMGEMLGQGALGGLEEGVPIDETPDDTTTPEQAEMAIEQHVLSIMDKQDLKKNPISWRSFKQKVKEKSGGKVVDILTKYDIYELQTNFIIRAVQGLNINRELKVNELMKLMQVMAGMQNPQVMMDIARAILKAQGFVPEEVSPLFAAEMAKDPANIDQPDVAAAPMQEGPGNPNSAITESLQGANLAKQPIDNNSANNEMTMPGNETATANPLGV